MPTENFKASRWTKGNLFFPTEIEVSDNVVVRRKYGLFKTNEMSIHIQKIASVHIKTGLIWSNILIESSGGSDPIDSHGHLKADALRIKELIESKQTQHMSVPKEESPTKACPYCAETIKSAARVCRFCNRDLPA